MVIFAANLTLMPNHIMHLLLTVCIEYCNVINTHTNNNALQCIFFGLFVYIIKSMMLLSISWHHIDGDTSLKQQCTLIM